MAKLRDKAAKQVIDSMRAALKGNDVEVYECDKGDGQIVFVEKGEHLPDGWVTKRSPKGVFHYCPNHPHQAPAKKLPNFFTGDNDHGESDE